VRKPRASRRAAFLALSGLALIVVTIFAATWRFVSPGAATDFTNGSAKE